MPIRRRSQSRILALQALCVHDAMGESFSDRVLEFLRDSTLHVEAGIQPPVPDEVIRFARDLVAGAWTNRKRIDDLLTATAEHWTVARMTPVDRNVLRLGVYELLEEPGTAPQIIINEAIELARQFGDAESASFVNGVLDSIRVSQLGGEARRTSATSPSPTPEPENANGAL